MKSIYTVIIITFIISLVSVKQASCQTPDWQWAKQGGSILREAGRSIAVDANGNIYAAGDFYSPGIIFGTDTLINHNTLVDFFIVKYDHAGNVLWAKSFGGIDHDYITGIALDAAGNLYALGYYNSPSFTMDGFTLSNPSGYGDFFISKLTPFGNVIWAKSYGGFYHEYAWDLKADSAGNCTIVGQFESDTLILGSATLFNTHFNNNSDAFIFRCDSAGTSLWAKSFGSNDIDVARAVGVDNNGNAYIGGEFIGDTLIFANDTLLNTSSLYYDLFIVKYDSVGNGLWARQAKGNGNDYVQSIITDASSNVFVAGYSGSTTFSFNGINLIKYGLDDAFIVKYNSSGTAIWAKNIGGVGFDKAHTIKIDAGNNLYLSGEFSSTVLNAGTVTLTNSTGNYYNIFIIKFDSTGTAVWGKQNGSTNSVFCYGSCLDANSVLYITGFFSSPVIAFGSSVLTNAGVNNPDDFYIAKLGPPCATASNIAVSACNNYVSPSGNYVWTISNFYTDTIPHSNLNGCDSIIFMLLTIDTIDITVTHQGDSLIANANGAHYKWLNCDSNLLPLNGDTNQVFVPLTSGNYAVEVSRNGCIDTSGCVAITTVSIDETIFQNHIIIKPNPAHNEIQISISKIINAKINSVTIKNTIGEILIHQKHINTPINVSALSNGIYFINIETSDGTYTSKFIKL